MKRGLRNDRGVHRQNKAFAVCETVGSCEGDDRLQQVHPSAGQGSKPAFAGTSEQHRWVGLVDNVKDGAVGTQFGDLIVGER